MANLSNRNYILFDHTADLGMEVYGNDERELFCNAAYALFDILYDTGTVAVRVRREMAIKGADREDLLVNFLRELLYLCNGEGLLLKEFVMLRFGDYRLEGTVGGEWYDRNRHRLHQEIKAVTYHQVRIEERGDGWKGRGIFDV